MTPPAHIASGITIGMLATDPKIVLISVIGALAPDIDGLFGKKIKDHRKTVFHAPLFWLLSFFIYRLFSFDPIYNYFFIGIFTHLLLDFISGRTAGIRAFFPFSKKQCSLFPLKPELGDVPVFPHKDLEGQKKMWKYYLENKFLVFLKITIIIFPIILFIL